MRNEVLGASLLRGVGSRFGDGKVCWSADVRFRLYLLVCCVKGPSPVHTQRCRNSATIAEMTGFGEKSAMNGVAMNTLHDWTQKQNITAFTSIVEARAAKSYSAVVFRISPGIGQACGLLASHPAVEIGTDSRVEPFTHAEG